jgi:putative oxidoreductase
LAAVVDLIKKSTHMKEYLFETSGQWEGFILRITAGCIMLPHGLQKLLGVFGGYGFTNTLQYFTQTMKLPWIIAVMIILVESLGAGMLILGVFTRLWALAFLVIMMAAIITTNGRNGLFMNWYNTQAGEGFEYHLLVIGICLALLITGAGKYSGDGYLFSVMQSR